MQDAATAILFSTARSGFAVRPGVLLSSRPEGIDARREHSESGSPAFHAHAQRAPTQTFRWLVA